ncbi:MAG: M14 family zinc carboxypeptidase [Rhizobacter sp.]
MKTSRNARLLIAALLGWAGTAVWAALPPPSLPASPPSHCSDWSRRLPGLSLALCEKAALQPSGARSVKGLPLYQRDVPARAEETAQPWVGPAPRPLRAPRRVLVVGGIHGDELSSSSLVFHWIAHAGEASAGMDWRFLPALNPDGLMLAKPTRVNANGVDLNRNFPTPRWSQEAHRYWEKRTRRDPRRFPGRAALSEPESRFLVQVMTDWKPDLIVSVHAPYGVLDFDGPVEPPTRLGRLHLERVGIFPGSLGHYGGVHKGVPVVTIELPNALRTPTESEMRQMWRDLLRWIDERPTLGER